jgi:hypothetical protein
LIILAVGYLLAMPGAFGQNAPRAEAEQLREELRALTQDFEERTWLLAKVVSIHGETITL